MSKLPPIGLLEWLAHQHISVMQLHLPWLCGSIEEVYDEEDALTMKMDIFWYK